MQQASESIKQFNFVQRQVFDELINPVLPGVTIDSLASTLTETSLQSLHFFFLDAPGGTG